MTEPIYPLCSEALCNIKLGGTCLKGLDLNICPNYVKDESIENLELSQDENKFNEITFIDLHDGATLNSTSASRITTSKLTRLIIIAGTVGSGKTTLVSSIYEMFQEGCFAEYMFAGSQTFEGFEARCYLSRLASGRSKADTERTFHKMEADFLHLKVRKQNSSDLSQDILFSDISGERFEELSNSIEECKNFHLLLRADHFSLLIDGEKLAKPETRQRAYTDAETILSSCLDAEMIGKKTYVDILFTKYDLLDKNEQALKFLKNIENKLKRHFSSRVHTLRFFEIAARPDNSELGYGYGLEKLFPFWVEETQFYQTQQTHRPKNLTTKLEREFDKYMDKLMLKDID